MDLLLDENKHSFFVDTPFWETSVGIGKNKFFAVNSALNDAQIATLEQIVDANNVLGNTVSNEMVIFNCSHTVHVPTKQMPGASVAELLKHFEFGLVQGMKAGNVLVEYWGRTANEGRTFVHFTMPNRFEIDTGIGAKPFTRVPAARAKVTLLPPAKPGFHSFKIECRGGDNPQVFMVNKQFFKGPKDLVAVEHLFRSIRHELDFRTVMTAFDKKNAKFIGISATTWSVKWQHVASYTEAAAVAGGSPTLTPKVSGPSGKAQMPSGGSPSDIDQEVRDILAMAAGPGPFVTADVIRQRFSSPTITQEAVNADFDPSFHTRR